MSARALIIEVGLMGDRWHGVGDWPPSPFRLFQALVAGAYGGRWAAEDGTEKDAAFRWLEALTPPRIVAPPRIPLKSITFFVPNNDLDAVGGDPRRVAEIRTAKTSTAALLEQGASFLYAWTFEGDETLASRICAFADRLHTFGGGTDAAFARAEVTDAAEAETRLQVHGGSISVPTGGEAGRPAPCPTDGSLTSLKTRYAAMTRRFQTQKEGRKTSTLFRQPPKAHAQLVVYNSPPVRLLYELRRPDDLRRFFAVPQENTRALTEAIRDAARARLVRAIPDSAAVIDRFLIGVSAQAADVVRRVRITPLPSLGVRQTSPAIRRVAVEVPPDCPIPAPVIAWAFTGVDYVDGATGEVLAALVPTLDDTMTKQYGFEIPSRRWRSVTPVVLPAARGRVRTGGERAASETAAGASLAAAVRHARVDARVTDMRIQREPFHARGAVAEASGAGRFGGRLQHVEITFDRPVKGPLVIGDGRFVGLGLMRPVQAPAPSLHLFAISPSEAPAAEQALVIAEALRRAVMARAQAIVGARVTLPAFFTGHETGGAPLRSGRHEHLFFLAEDVDGDGRIDRLAVIAPHRVDRDGHPSLENLNQLDRALEGMEILRAGHAGAPRLRPLGATGKNDRTFGYGRVWTSRSLYRPTRHPRRKPSAEADLREDILAECARRGLQVPEVEILSRTVGPRGGLAIRARLKFVTLIEGPVLLGIGSHFGAGLFTIETI